MKKIFLFASIAAMLCVACENKGPEQTTKICSGSIIGTIGCYGGDNNSTFYKGYFVETNNKDTVLSFNSDIKDTIDVPYGTYSISPINIPYLFYVTILKSTDSCYIHYAIPVEDGMHQPFPKSLDKVEQVIIIAKE